MAIPVSNPPPRYEPPPPSEPPRDRPPPVSDPARAALLRGCLMLFGVAAALGCIATIGLAVSCRDLIRVGEAESTRHVVMEYRLAAQDAGEDERYAADLDALDHLGASGGISLLAFGVLNNRLADALADDREIDADELHHGMELVHDIVIGNGSIDPNRYPDGR
jgi:hypothetical protein